MENLQIPHRQTPKGCLTVSIGASTMMPDVDLDPIMMLGMADEALYRAKAGGRNRVAGSSSRQDAAPSTAPIAFELSSVVPSGQDGLAGSLPPGG